MPESKGSLLIAYLMSKRVVALFVTCSLIALLLHLRSLDSTPDFKSYLPSFPTSNKDITISPSPPSTDSSSSSGATSPFHHDVNYPHDVSPPAAVAPVPSQKETVPTTGETAHTGEETEASHSSLISTSNFWPQFYAALIAATPRVSLPHDSQSAQINRFVANSDADFRPDLIHLDDADVDELASAHSWFVEQITSQDFAKPHFVPGSQGIVTTAGGHYLPEVIVAIRMLRRTGSTLPVDVFFSTPDEAEPELCDKVLASLGARCHTISELIDLKGGNLPQRQTISKYQLKVFALLLSDFDDILWIDTDEISVQDPVKFMDAEPFNSTGLVVWPDYWTNTASPLFYRIANIIGDRVPTPAVRASSETGQLLISKSRQNQLQTLQLAAYYNFHGPTHYYKLLSQGAMGEGDKETFLAAALALGAPFWAVQTDVQTVGAHNAIMGEWHGAGIVQADPRDDYAKYANNTHPSDANKVAPAFIHTTVDKPNAGRYARHWRNNVRGRIMQRLDEIVDKFGYDIEHARWDEMKWTACSPDMNGYIFKDWINNPEYVDESPSVCKQVEDIMAELFKDEEAAEVPKPKTAAGKRSRKQSSE